jgi:hypothetical protein
VEYRTCGSIKEFMESLEYLKEALYAVCSANLADSFIDQVN